METTSATYHLCPRCFRAVSSSSGEHYCPNDGTRLLAACPYCHTEIVSPYARFCVACGKGLALNKEHQISKKEKV
jgi:Double zinc ribbon